jgi:hypothetical protein
MTAITRDGATEAATKIIHHHAVLRRGLEQRAGAVCDAAGSGTPFDQPLADLRAYLDAEILPHAGAEERTLYQAAASQARGSELVSTLIAEHRDLEGLVARLQAPADGTDAASTAESIANLFAAHAAKENDLLLPALVGSRADLAALLADMQAALASGPAAAGEGS